MMTWVQYATDRATAIGDLQRAAQALRQQGIRSGLNSWCEFAREGREVQGQLQRALASWKGDGRRKAMQAWVEATQARGALAQAMIRLLHLSKYRAFQVWVDVGSAKAEAVCAKAATASSSASFTHQLCSASAQCGACERMSAHSRSEAHELKTARRMRFPRTDVTHSAAIAVSVNSIRFSSKAE